MLQRRALNKVQLTESPSRVTPEPHDSPGSPQAGQIEARGTLSMKDVSPALARASRKWRQP